MGLKLLILSRALVSGDVDGRKPPFVYRYRAIVRGRESYRRKVKSMIFRICHRSTDEAVVAVPQVQNRGWVDRPDLVNRALTRSENEKLASRKVVEVVVVVTFPIIPTGPPEYPVFVADILVYTNRVGGILRSLFEVGLGKVIRAVDTGEAGRGWLRPVLFNQCFGDRVNQVWWNDVVRKRVLLKTPAGDRAPRARVVNLVLGSC